MVEGHHDMTDHDGNGVAVGEYGRRESPCEIMRA